MDRKSLIKRNASLIVMTGILWLFLCLAVGAPIVISAPNADVDLAISKSGSPNPVVAGENLTYRLTITNTGPSTATGVTFTDTLPGGVTYTSATSGCVYNATSRAVRCEPGDVGVGSVTTATIEVLVDPSTTGSLLNQADVSTLDTDTNPTNNTIQTSTQVTTSADLLLGITAPATAIAGDLITYTFTIRNNGSSDASGVVLEDDFTPGSVYIASSTPCTRLGHIMTCEMGSVAANSIVTETITYRIDPGRTAALTNNALVSASTPDPNTTNNDASLSTPLIISSDVTISKNGTPDQIAPGEVLTYTITTTNNGLSNGQGVVISDTLPTQVSLQSYSATKGTCTGITTITCTPGSVTLTEIITVTLVGLVDPTASPGIITNTVSATSTSTDPDLTNNSATERTTIASPAETADLQISKQDLIDPVRAGELLTYTVTVSNTGPDNATGVVVTDTLPISVTLSSISASQGFCTGTICAMGTISATSNAMITMTVTVDPTATGVITNTATVAAMENDPLLDNNTARETTTILNGPADIQVTKQDLMDPVRAGDLLTYTISVSNAGPSNAGGVILTDTLPISVTLIAATTSQGSCTLTICELGALPANASATVTVTTSVDPAATGVITNTVSVSANEEDPVSENNSVFETTTIVRAADLSIEKTGMPDPVFAGWNLVYMLRINNRGPSIADDVQLLDDLPTEVTFVSAPAGCTHISGSINCDLGRIPPETSIPVTITVAVNVTATGLITNSASVSATTTDPVLTNNQAEWVSNVLAYDGVAPTVSWVLPVLNGQRYDVSCQTVRLQVSATDNLAVQEVTFYRWDPYYGPSGGYIDIGHDTTAPYQWDLNTCNLAANWNQVFARSQDTYGNLSERQFIWLYRHMLFLPVISR